jgi:hypothetical protein
MDAPDSRPPHRSRSAGPQGPPAGLDPRPPLWGRHSRRFCALCGKPIYLNPDRFCDPCGHLLRGLVPGTDTTRAA